MKTIISVLGWRRPEYLCEVFNGLIRNENYCEYTIIGTLDGEPHPACRDLMRVNCGDMYESPVRLGCNGSVLLAIERAFWMGAERVIMFEDDVVPGPDALEYFEEMLDEFESHPLVATIGGYAKNDTLEDIDYSAIELVEWFRPWGVGYWHDKFENIIRPHWQLDHYAPHSWDTHLMNYLNSQHYLQCKPKFSRVQNIGEEGGMHTFSKEWHNREVYTPYWSGNVSIPPIKKFRLTDSPASV